MKKLTFTLTLVVMPWMSVAAQDVRLQVLNSQPAAVGQAGNANFGNRTVMGRAFSATEERRSTQTLANGTRIETKQTSRLFRDNDGRTRVEAENGTVTIVDLASGFRAELNPQTKVVRKTNVGVPAPLTAIRLNGELVTAGTGAGGRGVVVQGQAPIAGAGRGKGGAAAIVQPGDTRETLTPQVVNGVLAQGVRITLTIPKGQIGNDRELKVVTEQWTSDDLQLLIKSANSDPRFGDTTYELTRVQLGSPDASLFQIPADYTLIVAPGPSFVVAPAETPGARGRGKGKSQ
ncbi:MAG: hypothetical protein ABI811_03500 [Acidobacteriota bacterium]